MSRQRSRPRSAWQIIVSFVIAMGFALALFKVGPALLTSWLPIDGTYTSSIVEGLIRVAVLIGCIVLIGLLPDLKRVLQLSRRRAQGDQRARGRLRADPGEGAEIQLDPPALRKRFFAMGHGDRVFVFALVGRPIWYWLIISRILLLPVIAGLAYELIRYAGKHRATAS